MKFAIKVAWFCEYVQSHCPLYILVTLLTVHLLRVDRGLPSHMSAMSIGSSLDARQDLRAGDKDKLLYALGEADYKEKDPVSGAFTKLDVGKLKLSVRLQNVLEDIQPRPPPGKSFSLHLKGLT